ncbi:MAG: hypothetical protein JO115_19215 [Pseudonocardiales bacterium]|nr:hypothetical protein [Pseudonocardiales bacterium]
MSNANRLRWVDVEPLGAVNGELRQVLASVDTLRGAWEVSLAQTSAGEFAEARRRSLRRHAIETGLIERLYDIDWGVTEALVAEGLTAEVAAAHSRERPAAAATSRADSGVRDSRRMSVTSS